MIKTCMRLQALRTHEIINQSLPLIRYNLYTSDPALQRMIVKSSSTGKDLISKHGKVCGSTDFIRAAALAEKNRPILKQFDNYGRRIDQIDYHESYHKLMDLGLSVGGAAYGFNNSQEPGNGVIRAALIYLENQLEAGHCCPIVMTAAAIPVLRRFENLHSWTEKICSQVYDNRDIPMEEKYGVTIGMSMTEKQGGSDVRAGTTLARPVDAARTGHGHGYNITGHKWFTSAPMSDGYLTLAKIRYEDAPSCFLIPRWLPDGARNDGFKVMRLKDKLGDRANASSEVEYDDAWGTMVGPEGGGVKTIIEMVQSTRLDCALGSAGGARKALQLALNHAAGRSAFGRSLIQQPLHENLLTDLCVEAEAFTVTAMHMAATYEAAQRGDQHQAEVFRVGVAVTKYFTTKRLPQFTYECMEAMGGNGYVEDFPMANLFRQSPLNSIWEGSGNIIALDVLRAAKSLPALFMDIKQCQGMDTTVDAYVATVESAWSQLASGGPSVVMSADGQRQARNLVDRLAVALQASALLRFGNPKAANAFIGSRIHGDLHTRGVNYGSYVHSISDSQDLIVENMPVFDHC